MPQFPGPAPGFPVPGFRGGPPWPVHGEWFGWHWLIPLLFLVGFGSLMVWAVLRVTRRPAVVAGWGPPPRGFAPDSAMEQARLRYARGEMTREDYLQVSTDLAPHVPPGSAPPQSDPGPTA